MHEGHRQRMYEKLKNGDALYEHELLEMLLFNAFQRKNTNPIAHALLDAFGSISGVLNAEVEDICAVEGVGENVALYLKCIGECTKRTQEKRTSVACLKSYADFKNFISIRFRGKTVETLEIYCLDKIGRVKKISSYTTDDQNRVQVDVDRIAKVILAVKPYGVLVAHNHLSGNSEPSGNDDRFTMELQLMCSMNNVQFYDHCIYASDNNIFSYFSSGKIDVIKREYSYDALVGEKLKRETGQKK